MGEADDRAESRTEEDRNGGEAEGIKDPEGLRERLEGLIPDMVRRTFYAGLGAVLSSEDGIRKLANEFSLPKDVASYLVGQAQNSKAELSRIVGNELRRFLDNLNLNEELQRLLTSLSFEIKTEIRFIPNDAQAPRPKVSQRVRIKRNRRNGDSDGDSEEEAG